MTESFQMSKVIKQMEMDALKTGFQGVRDFVLLSVTKLDCHADHGLRMALRKKNIRLQVVKNSLTRRVFNELGMKIGDDSPYWLGPTMLAWGPESAGELSRAIEAELKNPKTAAAYKDRVTVKGGIVDGQPIDFARMTTMPTRAEAIAEVLAAILGPAGAIAGCLTGSAAQVASQIQTLAEKEEEPAAATPA
jgi:large subunit ribosomal protein L10